MAVRCMLLVGRGDDIEMSANLRMAAKAPKRTLPLDGKAILTRVSEGRSVASYRRKQVIFSKAIRRTRCSTFRKAE